jgi:hypothetical protein
VFQVTFEDITSSSQSMMNVIVSSLTAHAVMFQNIRARSVISFSAGRTSRVATLSKIRVKTVTVSASVLVCFGGKLHLQEVR